MGLRTLGFRGFWGGYYATNIFQHIKTSIGNYFDPCFVCRGLLLTPQPGMFLISNPSKDFVVNLRKKGLAFYGALQTPKTLNTNSQTLN